MSPYWEWLFPFQTLRILEKFFAMIFARIFIRSLEDPREIPKDPLKIFVFDYLCSIFANPAGSLQICKDPAKIFTGAYMYVIEEGDKILYSHCEMLHSPSIWPSDSPLLLLP